MVYLARLAFDLALPNETPGSRSIPAPEREEHWIRKLFERAVGGFYSHVLDPRIWNVRTGEFLFWPISRKSSLIDDIMPSMKTDIILENIDTQSRIIIDTKFTEIVESGWYRDDSLKSKYLYQIYAYLRSQEKADDEYSSHATGILIHPAVGAEYNEFVELQDHTLRFITVDLAGKASKFREQLLIATPRQNLLNLEKSSVRN
jgi:5-methylcytosine-specific restriction enzyme subunit McrC